MKTMTKKEFNVFLEAVDAKIGLPGTTWEGPEPHDFRQSSRERGVRFVHSGLTAKLPHWPALDGTDYAPDGIVHFRVTVGDGAAAAVVFNAISSAGFEPHVAETCTPHYAVTFDVPVASL